MTETNRARVASGKPSTRLLCIVTKGSYKQVELLRAAAGEAGRGMCVCGDAAGQRKGISVSSLVYLQRRSRLNLAASPR